jgi:hypothetical protein
VTWHQWETQSGTQAGMRCTAHLPAAASKTIFKYCNSNDEQLANNATSSTQKDPRGENGCYCQGFASQHDSEVAVSTYYWWVFFCFGRQHYRSSCFFTAAWTMFNARWVRWRSYSELSRSWRKREGGFWKPIDLLLRLTAGLWFWLLLNWRLWRILLQCPEQDILLEGS